MIKLEKLKGLINMSNTDRNLTSTFQNLTTLENQIRELKETYDEELSKVCESLINDFPATIEDAYPYGSEPFAIELELVNKSYTKVIRDIPDNYVDLIKKVYEELLR